MKKSTMKIIYAALIIMAILVLAGCAQSIAKIKTPENVGKTVTVSGTVQGVIKLGAISGYTIKDSAGNTIGISTETLPKEGTNMSVTGVLIKDTLLGYYIKVS